MDNKLFKFRDLKIYCDNNSLAQDARFYRTVFDSSEINYLYFELTLFNKAFDSQDWQINGHIRCHKLKDGRKDKEMANLEITNKVAKDLNIITVREGWGMEKKGSYWEKGNYIVSAFIEDKLVGEKSFYIEGDGAISPTLNPYFRLDSVKLFNGSYSPPNFEDRKYLKKFNWATTQYVWVEYKIANKLNTSWNFECFINFYEKSGLQKSQLRKYYLVQPDKKEFSYTFDSGWGHDKTGTWKPGEYSVHLVCMGIIVAALRFEVGDEEIE